MQIYPVGPGLGLRLGLDLGLGLGLRSAYSKFAFLTVHARTGLLNFSDFETNFGSINNKTIFIRHGHRLGPSWLEFYSARLLPTFRVDFPDSTRNRLVVIHDCRQLTTVIHWKCQKSQNSKKSKKVKTPKSQKKSKRI